MEVYKQPDNSIAEILNLLAQEIDRRAKRLAASRSCEVSESVRRIVNRETGYWPADFGNEFFAQFEQKSKQSNEAMYRIAIIGSLALPH